MKTQEFNRRCDKPADEQANLRSRIDDISTLQQQLFIIANKIGLLRCYDDSPAYHKFVDDFKRCCVEYCAGLQDEYGEIQLKLKALEA